MRKIMSDMLLRDCGKLHARGDMKTRRAYPLLGSGSVTLEVASVIPSEELLDAHRYFKWKKDGERRGLRPPAINFMRLQAFQSFRSFKSWLLGYIKAAFKFRASVPVGTTIEAAAELAEAREAAEKVILDEKARRTKMELAALRQAELGYSESEGANASDGPIPDKAQVEASAIKDAEKHHGSMGWEEACRKSYGKHRREIDHHGLFRNREGTAFSLQAMVRAVKRRHTSANEKARIAQAIAPAPEFPRAR